jgi:SNW domain-containing protein 1
MRKNKIDRDEGRDISERIALGMLKGSGKATGEAMYDSRLFNQSAGMDSGFGADDEYSTYSKPLFERTEASSIYRPKRDDSDIYGDVDSQMAKLSDTSKFKPDKGFKGAEGGSGAPRDAPVQFERMREEDPFGIDDIVGKSKKARYD